MSRMPSQESTALPEVPNVLGNDTMTGSTGAIAVSDNNEDGDNLLDELSSGMSQSPLVRNESRTGILLLIVIIVAAGGILYTMRRMGMSARLEIVDVNIDYPLDERIGFDAEERDRLLKDLEESGRIVQVELKDLKMNPFAWDGAESIDPTEDPAIRAAREAAERARVAVEKRQREIENAADRLEVRSIMGGRTPIANISGNIVRVGDVLEDFFTVIEIKTRTVVLQVDDRFLEIGEFDDE